MPRDQEASLRHDPATGNDPLFRDRSGPARPDQDEFAAGGGATPIGDELAATHRDGPADDVTDAPGEWVAGSKGPGQTFAGDTADSATLAAPADPADVDPAATGTIPDLRATRDPEVAPDTALAADPDATGDAGVVPDSETTPANGIPVVAADGAPAAGATSIGVTSTDATPADATPADATPAATTPSATATPNTPVPGAPGTAQTTGVDAAAAFVTNGDELHADWARIQSSFVDDPRGSVSQAADLVSQATSSLVTAIQQREETLRGAWDSQGGGDTDTEHLRNALRDYRAFFERLVKL